MPRYAGSNTSRECSIYCIGESRSGEVGLSESRSDEHVMGSGETRRQGAVRGKEGLTHVACLAGAIELQEKDRLNHK